MELFDSILREAGEIINTSADPRKALQQICSLLRRKVAHYDWVGFYLVEGENTLVLGPYDGADTDHTKIAFGQGICGQAAQRAETFVVQDVSREDNYLSCSVDVKSEIVVPVFRDGAVVGELDIDSHTLSPVTEQEREYLERLCVIVADLL